MRRVTGWGGTPGQCTGGPAGPATLAAGRPTTGPAVTTRAGRLAARKPARPRRAAPRATAPRASRGGPAAPGRRGPLAFVKRAAKAVRGDERGGGHRLAQGRAGPAERAGLEPRTAHQVRTRRRTGVDELGAPRVPERQPPRLHGQGVQV